MHQPLIIHKCNIWHALLPIVALVTRAASLFEVLQLCASGHVWDRNGRSRSATTVATTERGDSSRRKLVISIDAAEINVSAPTLPTPALLGRCVGGKFYSQENIRNISDVQTAA